MCSILSQAVYLDTNGIISLKVRFSDFRLNQRSNVLKSGHLGQSDDTWISWFVRCDTWTDNFWTFRRYLWIFGPNFQMLPFQLTKVSPAQSWPMSPFFFLLVFLDFFLCFCHVLNISSIIAINNCDLQLVIF